MRVILIRVGHPDLHSRTIVYCLYMHAVYITTITVYRVKYVINYIIVVLLYNDRDETRRSRFFVRVRARACVCRHRADGASALFFN
jgi:hypothetical protein